MRKTILFFLLTFSLKTVFGQVDKNHYPVFKSEVLSEEKLDGFNLQSNYYPILGNISNRESFFFETDNPSLEDYLNFAKKWPSHLFIVHRGDSALFAIELIQQNFNNQTTFHYSIFDNSKHTMMQLPCNISGEITEKRASELLTFHDDYLKHTSPSGDVLFINRAAYKIQSYNQLKSEVVEIAKKLLLDIDKEKK